VVSAVEPEPARGPVRVPGAPRAGARPQGTAGTGSLPPREVEVLRLVAAGRSNDEITAELFLSCETVETHVSRILTKLGLRDRVQAVVRAYRAGLVTTDT
jgi:DNA-binding NarL/FixJ family response regulator